MAQTWQDVSASWRTSVSVLLIPSQQFLALGIGKVALGGSSRDPSRPSAPSSHQGVETLNP